MAEYCEICEGVALATSSCPNTDVIMVVVASADGSSVVETGVLPEGVLTSGANATSGVVIDAIAVLIGAANGTSEVNHSLVVTDFLNSAAQGNSSVLQFIEQLAVSSANAEGKIADLDIPELLISAANATSSVDHSSIAVMNLTSEANATSAVDLGLSEMCASTANASSIVSVLRRIEVELTSAANGTSTVVSSNEPQEFLLISTANGASVVQIQTEVAMLLIAESDATSAVWYSEPAAKAWVMNTESAGVCWYDNFGFESIAQVQGAVFGVGEAGIYRLEGPDDAGAPIEATVQTGFVDFGQAQTKRLDNMYFGYTSAGQISVQAETKESGSPPMTYMLEQRDADAPRNSRVTPGKGLWGRYWRLTIKNVDGAEFEVHDTSVDLAVSTRRI